MLYLIEVIIYKNKLIVENDLTFLCLLLNYVYIVNLKISICRVISIINWFLLRK